MCWSGLTLVAAPVLLEVGVGAYAALTLAALSPVMTAVLLLGLSGVPLLEKQVRDAMSQFSLLELVTQILLSLMYV